MTGYVVDRHGAVRGDDVVMLMASRARGVRSQVFLRDGSLYRTLTRPRRLMAALSQAVRQGYCFIGQKKTED
jgi:hypothetical protein